MNDTLLKEVEAYIERIVLCWLATVDLQGVPNVSPKEIFTFYDGKLLIAHIASPSSVRNIRQHADVCVSFIDVFVQKGFKVKGKAKIIAKKDNLFNVYHSRLTGIFSDRFPIKAIIEVTPTVVNRIIAPSYLLFPETKEACQIDSAKKIYLEKLALWKSPEEPIKMM